MIYFLRESSDLGLALAVTIKWVLGFLLGYLYLLRMFLVYSGNTAVFISSVCVWYAVHMFVCSLCVGVNVNYLESRSLEHSNILFLSCY